MTITSEIMRGILKGKCLPGDLRLNEEIPDYLARKLAEQAARIAELEAQPAPVAVPDERAAFNAFNNGTDCPLAGLDAKSAAWRAWTHRASISNSGSKPQRFVVRNWPTPQRWDYQSDGEFWGAKSMLAECKSAVESSGGVVYTKRFLR